MSNPIRRFSLAVVVAIGATSMIAVQMAEAGGTKRQRSRDGIMRLGGPANGNGAVNGNGRDVATSIFDRAGGVSFRNQADVRAFALSSGSDRGGPSL